MKNVPYVLLATALLFAGSASFAFAQVVTPLNFYCAPYTSNFTGGQAYIPTDQSDVCTSVNASPVAGTNYLIYRGTPGQSPAFLGFSTDSNGTVSYQIPNLTFSNAGSPNQPGQEFFAASFLGDPNAYNNYFESGGTAPGDYALLTWDFGAPATVTADPQTMTAGGTVPPLTATISGFINGDTLATSGITGSAACTTSATSASAPGDYPITCTIGTLFSGTYALDTFVNGNLHINPAVVAPPSQSPLTVTANNKTIELGSALPALTATLSGFVAPDTAASNDVTGAASCTTTATAASPVGGYPITCTVGTLVSAKNYTFSTFVPGTLTIVDTTAPKVTIASPVAGHTYFKNDTVTAAATITDLSPIASTVYKLNGTVINPANPLPLSSLPAGTTSAMLVVAATDSSGNTGYATSTFTVAPPDLNPPTITITSPINEGLYAKTDTVFLTATIADQSAIAATSYWFNGIKINPAVALPLSSAPLESKASVVATDVHGNTATSTVTIFVVKSTNSCLLDIISVLTQITQDKTLPNKPTILNLIADCTALLKGQHHY